MKRSGRRNLPAKLLLGFVVVACVFGAGAPSLWAGGPHYGEWSAPVNLGPTLNSTANDSGAAISKNGLSLYFFSTRPGGFGGNDLMVSQRATLNDPWEPPVNLGPTLNSASNEQVPALSRDGHWLFFNSDRPGGFGGTDIWASWRPQTHDDFGWQAPVNLGPNINTAFEDHGAGYLENDADAPQLYFGSDRQGPPGNNDIYESHLQPDGSWGPATRIPELSTTASEARPTLRHDGLEIFFYSNRAGGIGGTDLWTATRDTADAPWSTPVNLGAPVNTSFPEMHLYLAPEGETLFFGSSRPGGSGGLDMYMTTRSKSQGQ